MRSLRRWAAEARAVWEVPRDLLMRRYPPFVTGGQLPRGHVPVFVFHSVEPEAFERKLQHLADNQYVTLSASEYVDILAGARKVPERAVVLTFDDGRASVYSAGLPLLQRFGMKALLFLVPGRVGLPGSPAAEGFMNWDQVDELVRSGLFDVESHSLNHARIHTRPRLAGFITPSLRLGYHAMDVPLIRSNGTDWFPDGVALGTPFLAFESRTSEALRFNEDPGFREACVAEVQAGGGERFFQQPDWEKRLRRAARRVHITGRLESPLERELAIRRELEESKRQIEERTGRPVAHLCYPWHASGPTARRLAAELGYKTAFCGKVAGAPITPIGGDLLAIARLGEDYVELLPGRGRRSLTGVLRRKWRRRMGPKG
jgi:peptidoglycan/xylan/chitin deacetylase (PgdA/CDA1 family)